MLHCRYRQHGTDTARVWGVILVALACVGGWGAGALTAQPLHIIELRHLRADEVIAVLEPLLAPGDAVTGHGYKLFLRTSPDNLPRLQAVVARIDQAPRQLLITVLQGREAHDRLRAGRLTGEVEIADDAKVRVGRRTPRPDTSVTARVRDGHGRQTGENRQQVRVDAGRTATIYIGHSIPVTVTETYGGRPVPVNTYRDVTTGFAVTPHVAGQRVTIAIRSQTETLLNPDAARIATQHVDTVVTGHLGHWIDIGAVVQTRFSSRSGILNRRHDKHGDNRRVLIKVDEVE